MEQTYNTIHNGLNTKGNQDTKSWDWDWEDGGQHNAKTSLQLNPSFDLTSGFKVCVYFIFLRLGLGGKEILAVVLTGGCV